MIEMIKEKKSVGIIGAGLAGLSAGALLSKKGFKVTIFEKEEFIGGRALSFIGKNLTLKNYKKILSNFYMNIAFSEPVIGKIFDKKLLDGYTLDLGFHAIGNGNANSIQELLSEFNEQVDTLDTNTGLIKENGYKFPFISASDKLRMLPLILRLFIISDSNMKKFDSVPMAETIERYGKGRTKIALEVFSRSITTVNNLNYISTGEMLRVEKRLAKSSKPVGYPKYGFHSYSNALINIIKRNRGKIYLNKPVSKIIINKNKALGVVVENKKYHFNYIISNILVQNLFNIASEKQFPKEYVKKLKSLEGTGSLCAYYSLNKVNPELVGKSFQFIERNIGVDGNDAVGIIDFMTSVPEANLSPPGKYLVQSYIICTPKEAQDIKILKKLKTLLDKNLQLLIPNYKSNLNWAIYPAIWHLDGVAKTIYNDKPKIKTPIENLYLIGDCVKAPGIGMNCAVNSAYILTNLLNNSTN